MLRRLGLPNRFIRWTCRNKGPYWSEWSGKRIKLCKTAGAETPKIIFLFFFPFFCICYCICLKSCQKFQLPCGSPIATAWTCLTEKRYTHKLDCTLKYQMMKYLCSDLFPVMMSWFNFLWLYVLKCTQNTKQTPCVSHVGERWSTETMTFAFRL